MQHHERDKGLPDTDQVNQEAINRGQNVIEIEARALDLLRESLGEEFGVAVKQLLACKGRVIVSGLGKSGHVAVKIAATLASTGTPALFVHATEAAHGDLGMVSHQDVMILISNSGETADLIPIIQHVTRFNIPLIGISSVENSLLMRNSTIQLLLPKAEEACSQGIAPTTSTTMTLALGDALAMATMDLRGFSRDDYRRLHPGGSIGLRLMKISEIMHRGDRLPLVDLSTTVTDTILMMTSKSFGMAGVIDGDGFLCGVVTDGDLRRNVEALNSALASDIMSDSPRVVPASTLAEDALRVLHNSKITAMFVVGDDFAEEGMMPLGIVHVHDFLRLGLS